ncbi:MAG: hypothetical protein H6891_01725 [Brucellaceae bacterium]|nr:hypothetical protein [Brucellaceae bacterium]
MHRARSSSVRARLALEGWTAAVYLPDPGTDTQERERGTALPAKDKAVFAYTATSRPWNGQRQYSRAARGLPEWRPKPETVRKPAVSSGG